MTCTRKMELPYEDSTKGAWADVLGTLAGVLLLMSSGFWLLQGLAAVANDEFYAEGTEYLYRSTSRPGDGSTW